MAKLSTKERKAWEKKLKQGKVKMWKGCTYRAVTGFSYPRSYEKNNETPYYGGDAKINDYYLVNPKDL